MKFLLPLLLLGVALSKLHPRSYRRSSRIPKLLNFKLKIRDIYSFTGGLKNDRRIRPKIKTLITRKELRELHRRLKAGKYSSHHIRRLKFPFDRTNIFHRALPKAAFLKNTIHTNRFKDAQAYDNYDRLSEEEKRDWEVVLGGFKNQNFQNFSNF